MRMSICNMYDCVHIVVIYCAYYLLRRLLCCVVHIFFGYDILLSIHFHHSSSKSTVVWTACRMEGQWGSQPLPGQNFLNYFEAAVLGRGKGCWELVAPRVVHDGIRRLYGECKGVQSGDVSDQFRSPLWLEYGSAKETTKMTMFSSLPQLCDLLRHSWAMEDRQWPSIIWWFLKTGGPQQMVVYFYKYLLGVINYPSLRNTHSKFFLHIFHGWWWNHFTPPSFIMVSNN